MAYQLSELIADGDVLGVEADVAVTGVKCDSRSIKMGEAFFALPGVAHHGDEYAANAVERGARVVVSDRAYEGDLGVPVIVVEDVRRAYALAATRSAGDIPTTIFAVTGTNGKTSIASFVRQIWQSMGVKAASIGTLGLQVEGEPDSPSLTTPEPLALAQHLADLKSNGIDHVVVEASSHGLDQRRLDGLQFDAVAFTNLTRDHLDYHTDMDEYRTAKLRLFNTLLKPGGAAIVNSDDEEHMPFMFAALDKGATLLTVGQEGAYIEVGAVEQDGLSQKVTGKLVGEPLEFKLPLAGAFQVSNAVVAAAMVLSAGADKDMVVPALDRLEGAKGRMERVGTKQGASVFVDYSHTPDSLKTALEALRPFADGKLRVVFGAGGDRDPGKRALMGEVGAHYADDVIVTDDNPRTEDAAAIRAAIMAACPSAREIGDRAEAIRTAIGELEKGDVLLIAGKGHEDYQVVGTTKLPFSDHEVAQKALLG